MHVNGVKIDIVLSSGRVLPEVTNGGVTYVIASPGEQFSVRATSGLPHQNHIVYLTVDGVGVGYSKVLNGACSSTFEGIMLSSVGIDAQCQLFQFREAAPDATPAAAAAQPTALDSIQMGRIQVEVVQVVDTGAQKAVHDMAPRVPGGPTGIKLPDGKKWFLAPSLSASGGPSAAKKMNWDTTVWREVTARVKQTLRYETASTLMLRGILDENDPAHRDLIQQSLQQEAERVAATVAVAVKPEPAAEDAAGPSRAGPPPKYTQGRAAPERRRKQVASGGPPPTVDLSIEQDDNVLCDLTGGSPTWHWSKKPRIVIE